MKHLFYIVVVLASITATIESKASTNPEVHFLEMRGLVKQCLYFQGQSECLVSGTEITIFDEDKLSKETYCSDIYGKCNIKLLLNKKFEVRVSKHGFISKIVLIDTHGPKDTAKDYSLDFDIFLFEVIKDIDASVLKSYSSSVRYNYLANNFSFDNNDTDKTIEKLKMIYSDYYFKHTATNIKPVIVADEFVGAKSDYLSLPPIKIIDVSDNGNVSSNFFSEQRVIFSVQLVALEKRQLSLNSIYYKKCGKIMEINENGVNKYITGEFSDLDSAQSRLSEITAMGFKDAYIIAFKGKVKVNVGEATNALNK